MNKFSCTAYSDVFFVTYPTSCDFADVVSILIKFLHSGFGVVHRSITYELPLFN